MLVEYSQKVRLTFITPLSLTQIDSNNPSPMPSVSPMRFRRRAIHNTQRS
jgi:hypothetical protein